MKTIDTARALRDPNYRASLSAAELAQLPAHPAGVATVADSTLQSVTGGCAWTACNSPCDPNWGSTPDFSCVSAGMQCP